MSCVEYSREAALPEPGYGIGGKYRLNRLVGEGGMGVVYEALHLALGQRVAIKLLRPERTSERDAARFMREARAASRLSSRHVARVLDVDALPSGLPYMVMEFLDGRDLEQELLDRGWLGVSEAVDYVIQACDALAEAHALGIVHRDLKPSNLYLCSRGEIRVVKVLDFGISKIADEANVTATCTTLGTPLYMSPEQIRSSKDVDHRSDIWSLGVILFELLTGRPPFEGQATAVSVSIAVDPPPWPRTIRTDIPPPLEQIILQALEKDPARRHQTVADLALALSPFASNPDMPGQVRVSELPRQIATRLSLRADRNATTVDGSFPLTRRSSRRSWLAVGGAVPLLILFGMSGFLLASWSFSNEKGQPRTLGPHPIPRAPEERPSELAQFNTFLRQPSPRATAQASALQPSPRKLPRSARQQTSSAATAGGPASPFPSSHPWPPAGSAPPQAPPLPSRNPPYL